MSTIEDNDKHQNVDISNPQSENNDNLIADSQGESKQENEIVEEEKTPKPKLKGKASEVYKNKNTNKGPSTKRKVLGFVKNIIWIFEILENGKLGKFSQLP